VALEWAVLGACRYLNSLTRALFPNMRVPSHQGCCLIKLDISFAEQGLNFTRESFFSAAFCHPSLASKRVDTPVLFLLLRYGAEHRANSAEADAWQTSLDLTRCGEDLDAALLALADAKAVRASAKAALAVANTAAAGAAARLAQVKAHES